LKNTFIIAKDDEGHRVPAFPGRLLSYFFTEGNPFTKEYLVIRNASGFLLSFVIKYFVN